MINKIDAAGAEREFSNSKVKEHLRDMIGILKSEEMTSLDGIPVPDFYDNNSGSCFDDFIQHHVIRELCIRAMKDSPRGFLPLLLNFLASILQNVPHPLLPHVSVHRAVANLLFHSYHYESLKVRDSPVRYHYRGSGGVEVTAAGHEDRDLGSADSYKKRIGNLDFTTE